jgi:hypothetical protein
MATEDLTAYDWIFIRAWVGDAELEADITARYDEASGVPETVLLTLQHQLAILLEDPAQVQIGDLSAGTGDNIRAMQEKIKDFRANGLAAYQAGTGDASSVKRFVRPNGR